VNTLAPGYAQAAYPDIVQTPAHPSFAFALAHLHGHAASDHARTRPRVLDIGCNRGAQLRWIARTLPGATCLGLDALPAAIDEARAADNPKNLAFELGDLTTWDPGARRFDLIIAYGMLSWLPDPAREALLRLVARALAPGGVALICWIALPGGAATEALGQLLRLEQARQPGAPDGGIGRGPAEALRRLAAGMAPALAGPSMAGALHAAQGRNPGQLTADELHPDRRAFYLMEVLDAAAQSGLAYMGDAGLGPDWIAGGPAALAPALDGLPHLVALQYRDYLLHVGFRRSLFVRAQDAAPLRTEPDAAAALSLHAALAAPLAAAVRPYTDPPGEDGDALLAAIRAAGQAAPLSAVVARSDLPVRNDTARWGLAALRLAANNRIALSLGPPPPPDTAHRAVPA
jgi:SAM-dependent methyltransferase